jgi:hypothetical protein
MTRTINTDIQIALNKSSISGLVYLVKVTTKTAVYHWADRSLTYGGVLYTALVTDIGNVPLEVGDPGSVDITLANIDNAITILDKNESFLGAKLEIYELLDITQDIATDGTSTTLSDSKQSWTVDGLIGYEVEIIAGTDVTDRKVITDNTATQITTAGFAITPTNISRYVIRGAYLKWSGWCDELTDISSITATLHAYSGSGTTRCEVPRRSINIMCPWNFSHVDSGNDTVNFDGGECPYQNSSEIGFTTTLAEAIDNNDDPATFDVSGLSGGNEFEIDDEIKIDDEVLRVLDVDGDTLECSRALRGSVIAAHSENAVVKFYNCNGTKASCIRRGMYGNNSADHHHVDTVTYNNNYFGGFPALTANIIGRFRPDRILAPKFTIPVTFAGNESAYGKPLPLVYGKCRLIGPPVLIAANEGYAGKKEKYVVALIGVCEGTLADNATDSTQTNGINAYATNPTTGLENIFVNGKRRHDPTVGFGCQFGGGQTIQVPPIFAGVDDFETYNLNFRGTAWVFLRIMEENNADSNGLDLLAGNVDADVEIAYGRCVRVYTTTSAYTFKATSGDPAWMLLDFEVSKRAGGGYDYAQFDIQSFLDLSTYCNETVTNVVDGSSVPRWTFNGCVDSKKSFQDHEKVLALSLYALPPFRDANGKLKVRVLQSETLSGLPVFSSASPTYRNILVNDAGSSTLKKKRKSILEIPNEVKVSFVAYQDNEWVKTTLILSDREAQTQVGKIVGDGTTKVISRTLDLPGCTSVDEAARIGTLVLRAGEFAQGGLANNLEIEFEAFYRDSQILEIGDVIQVEDDLLDDTSEIYFRVIKIEDQPLTVDGGGIVFKRLITATLHDNDIYDDTAYTCTDVTRLSPWGGHGGEAPAVTDFTIVENGIYDKYGLPHSRLDIDYKAPGDYVGAIDNGAGYSAGASTIHVDGITAGKILKKHDLIYIDGQARIYQATADITFTSGEADVTITPVLTDDVVNNQSVRIVISAERDNFHSVVIMRSSTDAHLDPIGDWRFVTEIHNPPQSILYDISNEVETFVALSKNRAQSTPSPETVIANGNYKYPRVDVLVDGVADDTGPPSNWTVEVLSGIDETRSVIVKATCPLVNGVNLLRWIWQLNASITEPTWIDLDDATLPNVVYYDGSAIDHKYIEPGRKIERNDGGFGFGSAEVGQFILMDVRGSNTPGWSWDVDYCQWGTIESFYKYVATVETPCAHDDIACVGIVCVGTGFRQDWAADINTIRIKIVKPIWEWDTGGYLGGVPPVEVMATDGQWIVWDKRTEFLSPPLLLTSEYTTQKRIKLWARVWFENKYSVGGDAMEHSSDGMYAMAPHKPDDLTCGGFALRDTLLSVRLGCIAWKWNDTITEGEFRAQWFDKKQGDGATVDLRTVAEGGTFANDDDDSIIVTGISAGPGGCQYTVGRSVKGCWYYAFRLKNQAGLSVWSDGNDTPSQVKDFKETALSGSLPGPEPGKPGPPAQWSVSVATGTNPNTVKISATRPALHGEFIGAILVQLKDKSTGSAASYSIDIGTNASAVYFDGTLSYTQCTLSTDGRTLTRNGVSTGFGSASIGDVILMDVTGAGTFDRDYCLWGALADYDGYVSGGSLVVPSSATWIKLSLDGKFNLCEGADRTTVCIKIVKPLWRWTTDGYLGGEPNNGLWYNWYFPDGDLTTQTFISDDISIPSTLDIENVEARVWFENDFSRADDDTSSTLTGGTGDEFCVILTDADPILTNAKLATPNKLLIVSVDGDRTLGNPTDAKCGQQFVWRIINISGDEITITLDTKFRVGKAFPVVGDPNIGPLDITEEEA